MSLNTVFYDPTDQLTPMESALLQGIAACHRNPALTEQIERCRVAKREYSGCGFFTTLMVPEASPVVEIVGTGRILDGSNIKAPELSHGAASVLFLKDGRIHILEVFAYVDGDPAQVSGFTIVPESAS